MGVNISPLIIKKIITLDDLSNRTIAVDANNELHQFIALVRGSDGTPLRDREGNVTSHITGLMFRASRLIYDYNVTPIYVFDGSPPPLKKEELEKRRQLREQAAKAWMIAKEAGDLHTAYSKAVASGRLTKPMIEDSKRLLRLMGISYVEAPSEAEAQSAYMTIKGDVWATASRDYDSLLFGAPRLLRYITISGVEFLPRKGVVRSLKTELIDLNEMLKTLGISREQLIDLAILVGTDFNHGVKGVGPKKGLRLVKQYGRIEDFPDDLITMLGDYGEVREIFLKPSVTDDYKTEFHELDKEGLYAFLCGEKGFSSKRVDLVVKRMEGYRGMAKQTDLDKWFT